MQTTPEYQLIRNPNAVAVQNLDQDEEGTADGVDYDDPSADLPF